MGEKIFERLQRREQLELQRNLMRVAVSIFALAALAAHGQDQPDFSDAETLQKILGEAVLRDTLELRRSEGEKLYYAPDSETPYTGWAKTKHLNEKVRWLGHHKDGKPDGLATLWHGNGEKAQEVTYKDGRQEGPYAVWHDNGQNKEEGTYKGGKLEGLVTTWHENGQKEQEVTNKDGKQDGVVTVWDERGVMIGQVHFKNGKPASDLILDDPKTLEEIVGKAVKWDKLKLVGTLYHVVGNPEPHSGWIKKFHDNGKVAALGRLKGGKPDGWWTLWRDDGQKEEEILYTDGVRFVE